MAEGKHKVSNAQRREILQRNMLVLKTMPKNVRNLLALRDEEVRGAIKQAMRASPEDMATVVGLNITEPYLTDFYVRMYRDAGYISGEDALKHLMERIGLKSTPAWEAEVLRYIEMYTGARITAVTGTLRSEVVLWMQEALKYGQSEGIENLVQFVGGQVEAQWAGVRAWQVRRIVHTETMAALGVGQDAAVKSLGIDYVKQWTATFNNTRDQHIMMDGVQVGANELFVLPNGDRMKFPSDFSMGARAVNLINCQCGVYNIPKKVK